MGGPEDEFVSSLWGVDPYDTMQAKIEWWASRGDVDALREAGRALQPAAAPARAYSAVRALRHLELVLALSPGLPFAEALVELSALSASQVGAAPFGLQRRASLLAAGQSVDVLIGIFEQHARDDDRAGLLLLIAQEMVLRGVDCEHLPAVAEHWARMRALDHALAWLPLALTPIEHRLSLPSYRLPWGEEGHGWPPFGLSVRAKGVASSRHAAAIPGVRETTTPGHAALMASAVSNWEEESNTLVEARAFELHPAVRMADLSLDLFLNLGLDALDEGDESTVRIVPSSPEQAFQLLFAAAANGGAHSHGRCGACGRLDTWRSAAGLVGLRGHEPVDVVLKAVTEAAWVDIEAATNWYWQDGWNLTLAALHVDGRVLCVLAASDFLD